MKIGDKIKGLFGWPGTIVWMYNNVVLVQYANGFIGHLKVEL